MLCSLLGSDSVADGTSDAPSSAVGRDGVSLATGRSSETMLEGAKPNVLVAESLEILGVLMPRSGESSAVSSDGGDEAGLVLSDGNGTTEEESAEGTTVADMAGSESSVAATEDVGRTSSVLSDESATMVEESVSTTAVGDGIESEFVVMTVSESSAVASSTTGSVRLAVAVVVALIEVESKGRVKVASSLVVPSSRAG